MDKAKILDKIKKCLRMSASANANEAATALRMAQKMMEANGITQEEIDFLGYSNVTVDVPIQVNKTVPAQLNALLSVVRKAFGVRLVIETRIGISDRSYMIRYFGPVGRVEMAAWAHTVVYRAMENAWKAKLKESPYLRGAKGARASFQIGWLQEVKSKIEDIGWPEVEQATTQALVDTHYGRELEMATTNRQGLYGGLMRSGADAAKDFNLHRPMSTVRKSIEN